MKSKILNLKSNGGQAVLTFVILFLIISLTVIAGSAVSTAKEMKISSNLIFSKNGYFLAESGVEDINYRIITRKNYADENVLSLNGFYATTTVANLPGGNMEIIGNGDVGGGIRRVMTVLTIGNGASFNYGVQVGNGGFIMKNNSSVEGNVYSNGSVNGENSNEITGAVVSSGPSGLINGVHSLGDVYARTILSSIIGGDAYYQSISGSTVSGNTFPESPDQGFIEMPISDETINNWENEALAGGVIYSPCPRITGEIIYLGPIKIECDLTITGNPTIILRGPVWVTGDINFENSVILEVDNSFGGSSAVIIADNPNDRALSSKIKLKNSVQFNGTGEQGSYILLISQNNSAQNNGDVEAIEVENSVSGDLLAYAPHGKISLKNSVNLKEVAGYKIELLNSAKVIYETGLASLLFNVGPSG